jgi:hypothetical protein
MRHRINQQARNRSCVFCCRIGIRAIACGRVSEYAHSAHTDEHREHHRRGKQKACYFLAYAFQNDSSFGVRIVLWVVLCILLPPSFHSVPTLYNKFEI